MACGQVCAACAWALQVDTWDNLLQQLLRHPDSAMIRKLIDSHYVDDFLKQQHWVDEVQLVEGLEAPCRSCCSTASPRSCWQAQS
jgi:hypothetical protein